jgi:DNA-binding transcriptional LysR family regulator
MNDQDRRLHAEQRSRRQGQRPKVSRNCRCVYTLSQTSVDRWVFGARAEVNVQVAGNLRANNGDALRAAAIAGQGVIYQPTFIVADDLRAGTLVALTLDHPTVELGGIYAVFLPDRQPPAKVRAFIDFIATRFAPDPPWDRA